jgi:hypothetical protein
MAGGKNEAVEKRVKTKKVSLCFTIFSHFEAWNLNFRTQMLQSDLKRHTSCGWAKTVLASQAHCLVRFAHMFISSNNSHYIRIL